MRLAITHIWESRWFESTYTLHWKTRYTRHIRFPCQSTYMWHMLPVAVHVHGNLSQAINSIVQSLLLSRKRAPNTNPTPACGSTTQFLSEHSHWSSNECQESVDNAPSVYWAYNHQHAIGTFNTCSLGPTHQSLTNTGGGYNLRGASLPHTTPQPSQPMALHFSPKGLARPQVINQINTNWTKGRSSPKPHECELSSMHSMS
jgi:hypothetical protein